jgi:hypothetical protein
MDGLQPPTLIEQLGARARRSPTVTTSKGTFRLGLGAAKLIAKVIATGTGHWQSPAPLNCFPGPNVRGGPSAHGPRVVRARSEVVRGGPRVVRARSEVVRARSEHGPSEVVRGWSEVVRARSEGGPSTVRGGPRWSEGVRARSEHGPSTVRGWSEHGPSTARAMRLALGHWRPAIFVAIIVSALLGPVRSLCTVK